MLLSGSYPGNSAACASRCSAAQERAGLAEQAALQFAQRLGVGRLVGARFGGYGAALSGADVEPRLYGDAGEERYRGCEVFGREAGMEACEQFFVECPSDDGHDVALFGRRDVAFADGFRRKVLPVRKGRCDGLCRGDQCVHDYRG